MKKMISQFPIHDMILTYYFDEDSDSYGLRLLPTDKNELISSNKKFKPEPLIQFKLIGDNYPNRFSQGRTMRNSQSVENLKLVNQNAISMNDTTSQIITTFSGDRGYSLDHIVQYDKRSYCLEFYSRFTNHSEQILKLEMISSFTLGGLSELNDGIAPQTLVLHRLLSNWSAEGRLVSTPIEEMQLEPSWAKYSANCTRYGQMGSMPVNGYFPFVAVEDIVNNVTWAAQLSIASSWQMEVYRTDDGLSLSGGLTDREFGNWIKNVLPNEAFTTPKAIITVANGNVNVVCNRLAENTRKSLRLPKSEISLPIIFNEYCTTWGKPTQSKIEKMAGILKGKGIEYFVIDAGWYAAADESWEKNIGDWNYNKALFPDGIGEITKFIKSCGMRPGIWFEFEVVTADATVFNAHEFLLKRDGIPITSGKRRFLDLRKDNVQKMLVKNVIGFLKENDFEYLKIDYNDTLGIGCDGSESLGEGLRQQILAVEDFIIKIRSEIPEIVIESCSSGGHRLVAPFTEITSMSSCSDAHECNEIPIIAANMHRAILPRQSQIWAVFKYSNSDKKFYYQLTSAMLGRLCVSGEIEMLTESQWNLIDEGIKFYKKISHIIDIGTSERFGNPVASYNYPEGWQGIVRTSQDGSEKLIIIHTFNNFSGGIQLKVDDFEAVSAFMRDDITLENHNSFLMISHLQDFDGAAILLSKRLKLNNN